jgi:micrococcal nuclease
VGEPAGDVGEPAGDVGEPAGAVGEPEGGREVPVGMLPGAGVDPLVGVLGGVADFFEPGDADEPPGDEEDSPGDDEENGKSPEALGEAPLGVGVGDELPPLAISSATSVTGIATTSTKPPTFTAVGRPCRYAPRALRRLFSLVHLSFLLDGPSRPVHLCPVLPNSNHLLPVALAFLALAPACGGTGPGGWLVLSPNPSTFPSPGQASTSGAGDRQLAAHPAGVPPEAQKATVTKNVDGDTIWAEGGTLPPGPQKIRLLEIDTPEVGDRAQCFGAEASAFAVKEISVGSTVYLLADQEDKDRYGRYLRYAWEDDGEFYNEKAIARGYAVAVLYRPNDRYIDQMRATEKAARAARAGRWAACPPAGH